MIRPLTAPLAPFVEALPVPRRLVAAEHEGRLTVRMRPGTHRFHRDLPESTIWGYDGTVPGPTIEAERGNRSPLNGATSWTARCRSSSRSPPTRPTPTACPSSASRA
jgi:FtsP/CotA-like multicopper oxidase with cupredoxin domain